MSENIYIKCPVCGHDVEIFDICDVCGWHNSGPDERDDDPRGPNKITLGEAKEAYRKGEKID
ncbi:MAG TPA: CPCC family cysteine-rich protein [Fervidobacterium sp.]|jgi:hypothetical protein|nr:CPCC family cysteine-rich protein [Fervidobacterium sp.]